MQILILLRYFWRCSSIKAPLLSYFSYIRINSHLQCKNLVMRLCKQACKNDSAIKLGWCGEIPVFVWNMLTNKDATTLGCGDGTYTLTGDFKLVH